MLFLRPVTAGTGNWGWVFARPVTAGTGVNGLIGHLKQSLVGNISLQRSNCYIFDLTDTVALFEKKPNLDLRCSSKTKSVTPIFFVFLAKVDHNLSA